MRSRRGQTQPPWTAPFAASPWQGLCQKTGLLNVPQRTLGDMLPGGSARVGPGRHMLHNVVDYDLLAGLAANRLN